jgi:hypothetical protein
MQKILSKTIFKTVVIMLSCSHANSSNKLEKPPESIERFNEIAICYDQNIYKYFNDISPEEKVFLYYMYRASLPGNVMYCDQLHHSTNETKAIFEKILENKNDILKNKDLQKKIDTKIFINEIKTFLVYLWSNHGQYFLREFTDHKRTPESLNFKTLNKDNLISVCETIQIKDAKNKIDRLDLAIFDKSHQPTLTIPGSIDKSAINVYSENFTDKDFDNLPSNKQTNLNAYYSINEKNTPERHLYKIGEKYDKELQVSAYWLKKAHEHVKNNPKYFDTHFEKSLEYLIDYLYSGDENDFKKHSIEWLKTSSHLDYCFGFIEVYHDPKSFRGFFQAEATIKTIDLDSFKKLLPSIEAKLPFPENYKKDPKNLFIPNVSFNAQVFGTGSLGPLQSTAAYCLPNYEEIRSEIGSKQIIYPQPPSIMQKIKPKLHRKLFITSQDRKWYEENDPELELPRDIWTLHVLLHETIGHGSGKFAKHIVQEKDLKYLNDDKYQIGDEIDVTSENIQKLISPHSSTLEELRAEIIALYTSVYYYDELVKIGLLENWAKKIPKDKMIEMLIKAMAKTTIGRLIQQHDNAKIISGDHARADYTILNFLVEKGAVEVFEEKVSNEGKEHTVIGINVIDTKKALDAIKELAIIVQHIKSTGDGIKCRDLIDKYGLHIRNPEYIKYLKENRKAVMGDIKAQSKIYPTLTPLKDPQTGKVIDVRASWPKDFFEQEIKNSKLNLSTK